MNQKGRQIAAMNQEDVCLLCGLCGFGGQELIRKHLIQEHPVDVSRHLLAASSAGGCSSGGDDNVQRWLARFTSIGRVSAPPDSRQSTSLSTPPPPTVTHATSSRAIGMHDERALDSACWQFGDSSAGASADDSANVQELNVKAELFLVDDRSPDVDSIEMSANDAYLCQNSPDHTSITLPGYNQGGRRNDGVFHNDYFNSQQQADSASGSTMSVAGLALPFGGAAIVTSDTLQMSDFDESNGSGGSSSQRAPKTNDSGRPFSGASSSQPAPAGTVFDTSLSSSMFAFPSFDLDATVGNADDSAKKLKVRKKGFCAACGRGVKWKAEHVRTRHMQRMAFRCTRCPPGDTDYTVKSQPTIIHHLVSVHGLPQNQAMESAENLCVTDSETRAEYQAQLHLCYPGSALAVKSRRQVLSCALCGMAAKRGPTNHVFAHHMPQPRFMCSECGMEFAGGKRDVAVEHLRAAHDVLDVSGRLVDRKDELWPSLRMLRRQCFPPASATKRAVYTPRRTQQQLSGVAVAGTLPSRALVNAGGSGGDMSGVAGVAPGQAEGSFLGVETSQGALDDDDLDDDDDEDDVDVKPTSTSDVTSAVTPNGGAASLPFVPLRTCADCGVCVPQRSARRHVMLKHLQRHRYSCALCVARFSRRYMVVLHLEQAHARTGYPEGVIDDFKASPGDKADFETALERCFPASGRLTTSSAGGVTPVRPPTLSSSAGGLATGDFVPEGVMVAPLTQQSLDDARQAVEGRVPLENQFQMSNRTPRCTKCGRDFGANSSKCSTYAKRHAMSQHIQLGIYRCTGCDKMANRVDNVRGHITTKHNGDGATVVDLSARFFPLIFKVFDECFPRFCDMPASASSADGATAPLTPGADGPARASPSLESMQKQLAACQTRSSPATMVHVPPARIKMEQRQQQMSPLVGREDRGGVQCGDVVSALSACRPVSTIVCVSPNKTLRARDDDEQPKLKRPRPSSPCAAVADDVKASTSTTTPTTSSVGDDDKTKVEEVPPMFCQLCRGYSLEHSASEHVFARHSRFKRYKCPQCSDSFAASAHALAHITTTHAGVAASPVDLQHTMAMHINGLVRRCFPPQAGAA